MAVLHCKPHCCEAHYNEAELYCVLLAFSNSAQVIDAQEKCANCLNIYQDFFSMDVKQQTEQNRPYWYVVTGLCMEI